MREGPGAGEEVVVGESRESADDGFAEPQSSNMHSSCCSGGLEKSDFGAVNAFRPFSMTGIGGFRRSRASSGALGD